MSSIDMRQQAPAAGRSKERRVQLLISAACVIPALLSALQGFISAKLNGGATRWQDVAFDGGDWLALGMLIPVPYYLGRRFPLRRFGGRYLGVHVPAAFALALAWASLGMLLGVILHRYPALDPLARWYLNWILITIPFSVLIYLAVLGCVYGY